MVAHELWHIAYEHVLSNRIGDRDPEKWNIAADHVINLMLESYIPLSVSTNAAKICSIET